MKQIRYWLSFTTAFIARFKGILFVGIIAGLFFFAFMQVIMPNLFPAQREYVGYTGRYHVEDLPNSILENIGDGLTSTTETGEVIANLAESWEVSDSGKQWEFKLKEGLTWHDGTPVTSETINYVFEDVQVERPDSSTIIFKLSTSFSPFPVAVSRPIFKKGLIGTGDWQVSKISFAGSFVEEIVVRNLVTDERKHLRFYPTQDRAKLAYKLGKVDKLVDILDPSPFDNGWNSTRVESQINTQRYVAVFFNNENGAFKENTRFRQALYYAIDKGSLSESRSLSPISPTSWAYNPQVKTYDYDVERAKGLLDDMSAEFLDNLEIKLDTTATLLPVAEKIEKYWEEIGINTTVQVVSALSPDYQAFLAIYDIPIDPDQYSTWHSTQISSNIANFSDPRIDKLLEDGRLETDLQERKKIYLDFQRFLLESAPAIFLYHPYSYTVVRE